MPHTPSSFALFQDDPAMATTAPPPYYASHYSPIEAHATVDSFQEEKVCRICLCSNEDDRADTLAPRDVNSFIRPCLCKGTMAFVHVRCLQRWRKERVERAYTCEICNYSYNISRPFWASIIGSRILAAFLALLTIFGILLAMAYIVKVIDLYGFHHTPKPEDLDWQKWHGTSQFIWLDRFYLLVSLLIVAFFGFIAVGIMSCAPVQYDWGIAPPSMSMAACDMGSCGDCGIVIVFVIAVVGFFAALFGVYALVYILLSKLLYNAKERVLEVID